MKTTLASARWDVRLGALCFAVLVWIGSSATTAEAQGPRTQYIVRMLQTAPAPAVRVEAALTLGAGEPSPLVTRALVEALGDDVPVVRAAALRSLQRVGDETALDALRQLVRKSGAAEVRAQALAAISAIERRPRQAP